MDALRELAYRWFVRFNPLYFFSALCILLGVFFVSGEIDAPGWEVGRVGLAAVLEAYQALLILASALLFRIVKDPRPATILGLLAVAFSFDPSYQLEVVTAVASGSGVVCAGWLALTWGKVAGLAWAFRLRPDRALVAIPLLGAAALVTVPSLLVVRVADPQVVHVLAVWYFALLLAATLWLRPVAACSVPLDDWGHTVLRRAVRGALAVWGGLYVSHIWSWAHLYDVHLSPFHVAPILLVLPFVFPGEATVWLAAALATLVSVPSPHAVAPTAVAVAAVFGWFGWHTNHKRLWSGAVLAAYLAVWTTGWTDGPLPEPPWWLVAETGLALVMLAWSLRLPSVAAGAAALGAVVAVRHSHALGPFGWGVLLLALGFVSLAAGVAFNWRRRAQLAP